MYTCRLATFAKKGGRTGNDENCWHFEISRSKVRWFRASTTGSLRAILHDSTTFIWSETNSSLASKQVNETSALLINKWLLLPFAQRGFTSDKSWMTREAEESLRISGEEKHYHVTGSLNVSVRSPLVQTHSRVFIFVTVSLQTNPRSGDCRPKAIFSCLLLKQVIDW